MMTRYLNVTFTDCGIASPVTAAMMVAVSINQLSGDIYQSNPANSKAHAVDIPGTKL
jgi:pyridoxal biosynthesis lyase PdxS